MSTENHSRVLHRQEQLGDTDGTRLGGILQHAEKVATALAVTEDTLAAVYERLAESNPARAAVWGAVAAEARQVAQERRDLAARLHQMTRS